ncbi:hypothetical protein ACFQ14_09645 [Pseudahrensia aquimaris]|uniref:Uncharacterized protein n=1 Tax=Pseudahrensia aquimaris TaxID=744461 RepID=A0ABW3FFI3_9HYPH
MLVEKLALARRALMFAFGLSFTTFSHAQTALSGSTDADANPDPVFVFNRICYAQVHDFSAIREMSAKLAWRSMGATDLKAFQSVDNPTALEGWDVQVGERLFRVGIQKSGLTDAQKKTFPDFAGGTASTCSIVLDDQQDAAEFMPNMQRLAGKEPISKDVSEGLLNATTWAGGNDDIKVFLVAKAPPTGNGGLLNVTLLQK